MKLELNGFRLTLSLLADRYGHFAPLNLTPTASGATAELNGLRAELTLSRLADRIDYKLSFTAPFATRLRLQLAVEDQDDLFHLIPGNIHGDNNAAHVRPGEFPCLTHDRPAEKNCAALWEFRADRASHPVSILACSAGAVGISIDPYSDCPEADDGFIRNGVFAGLPNLFGVSLGYGNDPLTFVDKRRFQAATSHQVRSCSVAGTIHAHRGAGRLESHRIIRSLYEKLREPAKYQKTLPQALRALADTFATVSWIPELQQYTNRRCNVPTEMYMRPWRAVVEIGWTGGSMMAYPFAIAEHLFPDLKLPKDAAKIFDEICTGFNAASGLINDAAMNRFTRDIPEGWNKSEINGWWSGFLPQTSNNHCAYTNAHAAYYLLLTAWMQRQWKMPHDRKPWIDIALRVLDTAVDLQREDGAYGYIFSGKERKVVDFDGFAGCWFAAALPYAWKLTGKTRYLESAERAMHYYATSVRGLACWGSPMDTYKSNDSEGNLAFIRAARLLHQFTGKAKFLEMLRDGAHYEYLWRYGFRTRPQCPPLKGSNWSSCGGSITSVSNPHMHPMSVVIGEDLRYLAAASSDNYHQSRADDTLAWIMNTLEQYPQTMGYGQYGLLSERTCPTDGLLIERYHDTQLPASTWWSYNTWAASSAMEAIGERILAERNEGAKTSLP